MKDSFVWNHEKTKHNQFNEKNTLFLLPLAILATASPLAAAPFGGFQARMAAARQIGDFGGQMDLSDQQRAEIKEIVLTYKADISQQMKAGQAARKQMMAAVKEHGPKSAEAEEAAEYVGEVAQSRALLMGEILTDVAEVLTDEQIARLEKMKDTIMGMVEERMSAFVFPVQLP